MSKLYHGSRAFEAPSALNTSKPAQVRNGRIAEWLFATHRLDQATLYAAPFAPKGSFLTTFGGDPNETLALFATFPVDRFTQSFVGRVYSFSNTGFEQVKNNPREWVRNKSVDLEHAEITEVTDYRQIMEAGVQIFCLNEGAVAEIFDGGSASYVFPGGVDRKAIAATLNKPSSSIIWVNRLLGAAEDKGLKTLVDARNGSPDNAMAAKRTAAISRTSKPTPQ